MEDDVDRSTGRTLLVLGASPVAAAVLALQDAPALDVALWAVLAPILLATVLGVVARVRQPVAAARGQRAEVVLPDARPGGRVERT